MVSVDRLIRASISLTIRREVAWGYGGSGPAQLALALLADVFDDDGLDLRYHQDFKWKVIAADQTAARHRQGLLRARN
jgi:hypothetical protein